MNFCYNCRCKSEVGGVVVVEKKNEFRASAAPVAFLICVAAFLPLFAAERSLGEFEVLVDTNAVINVESGDVAIIDRLAGDRGTITKTGGGMLRVCEVRNDKVKFAVNGGKLLFDRPQPSALDKAFFHVDASRSDTLVTEEVNGTNFVVRWNDVRGNGIFATNCMYTAAWRPNPENRRAFISSVTQNGMPVVDFGEMLHVANTNSLGAPRDGYGASMIWNGNGAKFREVYEVISDTPDVATIAVVHPEFNNTSDNYQGVSFLSYSQGRAAARRGRLRANGYPILLTQTSSNYAWMQGRVYVDGELTSTVTGGTIYGKVYPSAGFNLLGFTSREYDETLNYADASIELDSFARDHTYSFGGQRLAEYLVFTNRLDAAERTALQDYLYKKWKGNGLKNKYRVSSISVAEGASVEMAPGVSVDVAHVSDGADAVFASGSFEINPLNIPEANFHVDASLAESLAIETVNGTNFVNHWADILSNGVYATAATRESIASANEAPDSSSYLPDPENRRPFISKDTLNGFPVVDFGSLLVASYTNAAGYGVGYGACMKWNRSGLETREVFIVSRDTEDVDGLSGKGNIVSGEYGMAHICVPNYGRAFRGKLKSDGYPAITVQHASNGGMYGEGAFVKIDGEEPISGSSSMKNYSPAVGFHVFDFRLSSLDLTPDWFGYSVAKDGSRRFASFGGTKIAEYIALPVTLDDDVRQTVHSALRTKWFGVDKRDMAFKNLTVGNGAEVKVPWNTVSVSGILSIGGEFDVSEVSAANLSLTGEGAGVSGTLTVADGAEVEVRIASNGSVSGLSAENLVLDGGGSVVLVADEGAKMPEAGSYPVAIGTGSFEGLISGWELDATAFTKRSCALELRQNGIYLNVAPKGLSVVIR